MLIDYELAPISDLITDPDVKASVEAAVKAYVQEQRDAWTALDKCPPTCGAKGSGSCAKGASSCTCTYKGLAGRMCTGCVPAVVRGTFTDKDGHEHSGTATVKCDGKDVVAWSGESPCTALVEFKYGSCTGTGSVSCSRAANGDLVAHVHQPPCTITEKGDDDDDDDNATRGGATAQARRLRGARGVYLGAGSGSSTPVTGQCGKFDAKSSAGTDVTGASATVEADPDKHEPCITEIPSGRRRRNKAKTCQLKAKCEFV